MRREPGISGDIVSPLLQGRPYREPGISGDIVSPLLPRLMAISFTRPANIFRLLSNGSIDRGSTSRFNNRTQRRATPTQHESPHYLSHRSRGRACEQTLCDTREPRRANTARKSLVRTHGPGSTGSQNRPHTNTDEIWGHRICSYSFWTKNND